MEQLVKVTGLNPDGTAQVLHIRQSACSGDCHQCAGCGAVQQKMLLSAGNPIHAQPGDFVMIQAKSGPVLTAAAVLYMLPLLLFFVGYLVSHRVWQSGSLGGGIAFALGIAAAAAYDRCVVKKQKTVYTITGFAQDVPKFWEKGDNDLD